MSDLKQTNKAVGRYNRYLEELGIGSISPYDFSHKGQNIANHMGYMLDKTIRMFDYENLPDTIPAHILEKMLQMYGYVGFTWHDDGYYIYYGGLGGEPNVYYMPTLLVVANPAQNFSAEWKIGEDVVLIKNDPLHLGMIPLYQKYATLMSENEISLRLALINTRIQKVLVAPDDNTYKSMKQYIQRLLDGELEVISDNPLISESKMLTDGDRGGYLQEITATNQYLKASWYNEIGLDANWNTKSTQLYSAEAQMNRGALMALADMMLKEREAALEEINKKYGLNIKVRLADLWQHNHDVMEGVTANGNDTGTNPESGGNNPSADGGGDGGGVGESESGSPESDSGDVERGTRPARGGGSEEPSSGDSTDDGGGVEIEVNVAIAENGDASIEGEEREQQTVEGEESDQQIEKTDSDSIEADEKGEEE